MGARRQKKNVFIDFKGKIYFLTESCSFAEIGAGWPFLLGGRAHWTVGLVATLISMSSIIAADTFAFLGGKVSSSSILHDAYGSSI